MQLNQDENMLTISLLIQLKLYTSFQNMHEVKCKERISVNITRICYSYLQLTIRGKQLEEFYIQWIIVSENDFNE